MKNIFIKELSKEDSYDIINSSKLTVDNINEVTVNKPVNEELIQSDSTLEANSNYQYNQEEFLLRQQLAIETRDRITELKEKLVVMRGRLNQSHAGAVIDVQVDSKDKFLMKAIKKVFKMKTDIISKEMYLEAKKRFNELQQSIVQEVKDE